MFSINWVRVVNVVVVLCAVGFGGCASANDAIAPTNLSTAYTGPQVTVLVTNATCGAGHCDSLDVRLFPQDQLITPAGFWNVSIGAVTGPQQCLIVPMSEVQRIIGPVQHVYTNPDGTQSYGPGEHPDTTMNTWTPKLAAALGVANPQLGGLTSTPSTNPFVAGASTGWSVTLPGGQPVAAPACH